MDMIALKTSTWLNTACYTLFNLHVTIGKTDETSFSNVKIQL